MELDTESIACQISCSLALLLSFFICCFTFFQTKLKENFFTTFPSLICSMCNIHFSVYLTAVGVLYVLWYKNDFVMWCLHFEMLMSRWTSKRLEFVLYFIKKTEYAIDIFFALCVVRFVYHFHWLLLLLSFLLSSFRTVDGVTPPLHCFKFFHLLRLVIDLCRSIFIFIFIFSPIFWNVITFCHTS